MKITALTIILFLLLSPLYTEDQKDKFDFNPPEVTETPLVSLTPSQLKPETGLLISLAGMTGATVLSYVSMQSALNRSIELEKAADIHQDILLAGTAMIGAAVFAVFSDYFYKEIQKKKATSEE